MGSILFIYISSMINGMPVMPIGKSTHIFSIFEAPIYFLTRRFHYVEEGLRNLNFIFKYPFYNIENPTSCIDT